MLLHRMHTRFSCPHFIDFVGKYCFNVLQPLKGTITSSILVLFQECSISHVNEAVSVISLYCSNFLNNLRGVTYFTPGIPSPSSIDQYISKQRRVDSHQDEQTKVSLHFSFLCWNSCRISYLFDFFCLA